jgi:protein-L-isoaspartate O-methyltransferase
MSAEGLEVLRQHMLAEISAGTFHVSGLIGKVALDERVMTAMGKVPRHEFVPVELGGFVEDGGGGAGLVFTRSGGHWTLDNKLVGTSAVGKSAPSVGLSADGSVVTIGGSRGWLAGKFL